MKPSSKLLYVKVAYHSFFGGLLMTLATVTCVIDPVHIIAKHMVSLSKGSLLYETLAQEEMPCAWYQIYLFNVTNGDAFRSGQDHKLKLEEVGPFSYQEFRNNSKFEVDEEAGVLRYSPQLSVRFLPEKSMADPRDVHLQMVNLVLLSGATKVSEFSQLAQFPFNMITRKLHSTAVQSSTAYDFLWGQENPLIDLARTFIPGAIDFPQLGILDRIYSTGEMNYELGISDTDKFRIKTFNGKRGLTARGYSTEKQSRCNTFEDTYEGISYPTDLRKDQPIRLFRDSLCRMLDLEYQSTKTMDSGAEGFVYKLKDSTYSMNSSDTQCLCEGRTCVDGISNVTPCFYDAPIAISNAHFLHGDPRLADRIDGLHPSEEKHGSEIVIDPKLGIPLSARMTLQANLMVGDVSFNSETRAFSNMIIPVLYFKLIQPEMTDGINLAFWCVYTLGPYLRFLVVVIFFLTAIYCIAKAFSIYYSTLVVVDMTFQTQVTPLVSEKETIVENGLR